MAPVGERSWQLCQEMDIDDRSWFIHTLPRYDKLSVVPLVLSLLLDRLTILATVTKESMNKGHYLLTYF